MGLWGNSYANLSVIYINFSSFSEELHMCALTIDDVFQILIGFFFSLIWVNVLTTISCIAAQAINTMTNTFQPDPQL